MTSRAPRLTARVLDGLRTLAALAEADLDADQASERPAHSRKQYDDAMAAAEWVHSLARHRRARSKSK